MSGFGADWLSLREPADTAARSTVLREQVAVWVAQGETLRQASLRQAPLSIIDLGAGTGSTLRWLAPVLPGPQQWLLVDHDTELLAALPRYLRDWTTVQGRRWQSDARGGQLDDSCRVVWQVLDLAHDLDRLPWDGLDLITASALLDLVSADWLDRLMACCAEYRVALYCTLSFDGELSWSPALAEDERMARLFARHQHGDKGFGPALGPDATDYLMRGLRSSGYQVIRVDSPWRLDREQAALQRALLAGYRRVIDELAADDAGLLEWWDRREVLLPDSTHRVGHQDVFAWLP